MSEQLVNAGTDPDKLEFDEQKRKEIVEKIIMFAIRKGISSNSTIINLSAQTLGSPTTFESTRSVLFRLIDKGLVKLSGGFTLSLTSSGEEYLFDSALENEMIEELLDAVVGAEEMERLFGSKLLELINSSKLTKN